MRHHHTVTALRRDALGRVDGADGIGSAVARLAGALIIEGARHAATCLYG